MESHLTLNCQFILEFLLELRGEPILDSFSTQELTKSSVDCMRFNEAEDSFSVINKILSKTPFLAHHDPSLPLCLSTDTSPLGLGAVLSHLINGLDRPIAFAQILDELHLSHRAIVKMKSIGRCTVRWPNIDNDITNLVNTCNICQANAPSPTAKIRIFSPACPVLKLRPQLYRTLLRLTHFTNYYDGSLDLGFLNGTLRQQSSLQTTTSNIRYRSERCKCIFLHHIIHNLKDKPKGLLTTSINRSAPLSCEKSPGELLFGHNIRTRLDSLLANKSTPMKEPIREITNVWSKNTVIHSVLKLVEPDYIVELKII
ncbi:unnamed protein product [Lepeophtheirus salmonis]|uniref:RNA-directed DNA polymerase n=1 Tax=Lepeophtheirus salmonis TaxID=72036 RepID=A0A7R8CP83_LEPSM|nr:unnamed protein product [Lepeophtheirus salmonis]CAF2882981.1 unnamed protein product [Lepeophtheirus salmonis]